MSSKSRFLRVRKLCHSFSKMKPPVQRSSYSTLSPTPPPRTGEGLSLPSPDPAGRYTVAVKVIDIFGNDTMTLVPVNVG